MKHLLLQANKYLKGDLSYMVGVSIFLQLSRNEPLKRLFLLPRSDEREQKLKDELSKITKLYEPIEKTPRKTTHYETSERLRLDSIPQELYDIQMDGPNKSGSGNHSPGTSLSVKLHSKRKELYRLRGHLHGQLHTASSDEERHSLAKKIMSSQSEIDELNRDLRMIEDGSTPSKYLKKDLSAEDFVTIKNLKIYISRYETKIQNCQNLSEKKKYEELLEKHRTELKRIS